MNRGIRLRVRAANNNTIEVASSHLNEHHSFSIAQLLDTPLLDPHVNPTLIDRLQNFHSLAVSDPFCGVERTDTRYPVPHHLRQGSQGTAAI